ncbi:MAG: amidase [Dokdonella sp.]|uniref:amidase n=1 Tax=Dokdonella sp. TaxID=2291710 RepID=UPI001B435F77|nr:amidase [Dokdonella sp.]MBK8123272.1 amidase [Dokdonella sp.]MBP6327610.1 amidase [Dokdonella sp.]
MTESSEIELSSTRLRGASAFQQLHWLASGRVSAAQLTETYLSAIDQHNPALNAYVCVDSGAALAASTSDQRRAARSVIGRLDGLSVAIKDNMDVAGLATGLGLASRRNRVVANNAAVVNRLRAAGAVVLGKTETDEAALGTTGSTAAHGPTRNPLRPDLICGGSSAGSAVAVAAGLCSFAIGTDTLGSVRIPASHCGIYGLRPTLGEISMRGVVPAARRLDTVGILARSVQDLTIVLQVLGGYDAEDARSRRRRVALSPPDWEPGRLRSGFLPDLQARGVSAEVCAVFNRAADALALELGERIDADFSSYDFARTRRAALLIMESELACELEADLDDGAHPVSQRLRDMLRFPHAKSAIDYAAADRLLDAAVRRARRLFEQFDVLVLPTVSNGPYRIGETERASDADLCSFASVAGCPAVSLPMGTLASGMPVGLQLIGAPGSDLRLLDLAEVCAATLDAEPTYPVFA